MAFDDVFRERISLEPDQTYDICRMRKRAEIYDLAGFGDPMAEWSRKAQELGATIVPRQVYVARIYEQYEHRVAWVYHSQTNEDSVENYHHIACDCVARMEDPDNEIEEIVQCPAVLAALEHRAARVNEVLHTQGILDFYGKINGNLAPKEHTLITIKAMVNFLMNYEQQHPEGWIANTVSGEHQVPLLATVFQIQPYPNPEKPERLSMLEIAQEMHEDGSIVLHEEQTITLPQAA